MQFRVLSFGLLQDGNVRIGVFPRCEKVRVGSRVLLGISRTKHDCSIHRVVPTEQAYTVCQYGWDLCEISVVLCIRDARLLILR